MRGGPLIGLALPDAALFWFQPASRHSQSLFAEQPAAAPSCASEASVVVSTPHRQGTFEPQLQFLGQFSAVDSVELRAQVGGTLTSIGFKDGDIVKQGDRPLHHRCRRLTASSWLMRKPQVEAALRPASPWPAASLVRAKTPRATDGARSAQRTWRAGRRSSSRPRPSLDDALAAVRDAQFDLDHCQITAPFTGRIGSHQISVGNLVAGSRAATSPTTLLATIVSIDSDLGEF